MELQKAIKEEEQHNVCINGKLIMIIKAIPLSLCKNLSHLVRSTQLRVDLPFSADNKIRNAQEKPGMDAQ